MEEMTDYPEGQSFPSSISDFTLVTLRDFVHFIINQEAEQIFSQMPNPIVNRLIDCLLRQPESHEVIEQEIRSLCDYHVSDDIDCKLDEVEWIERADKAIKEADMEQHAKDVFTDIQNDVQTNFLEEFDQVKL